MLKRARLLAFLALLAGALARVALVAQTAAPPDPADAFFDDTVVHEIRLAVNSRDWQSLKDHFQENTYYPADFRWRDQVVRYVGIRSRGNGSRRPQKPSLRLDTNRYTAGQQFLGLKSFILRNNSQDPTNLRERLSMLFFRLMGVAGAEREAHARLFVNNEYAGLYTIVESPDKDFLERNFGERDGRLYNYQFDDAANLAGLPPFVFQYLGSDPSLYVPSPFKPETQEDDPQGEVLARFIQTINDTNAAAWRTNMAQYLDLRKFIRYLAVENFLAEEDGLTGDYGPNNFYLYRFVNSTLFTFLPWDKSNTFWATDFSIFRNITDGPADRRNRLVLRALQEPDLLQLYLDTVLEAADSASAGATPPVRDTAGSPGWLEAEMNREYDQIHAAALADTLDFTNAEFEQAIIDLKAFARDRGDVVRAQVAAARNR